MKNLQLADLQKQLTAAVTDTVKKFWPALVAMETLKLHTKASSSKTKSNAPRSERVRLDKRSQRFNKKSAGPVTDNEITEAYDRHHSKTAAAKALGMAETTFRERLKKVIDQATAA